MTPLSIFFTKKLRNKALVSRRIGIIQSRPSQLTTNESAKLRADELFLVASAIEHDPMDMFKEIF